MLSENTILFKLLLKIIKNTSKVTNVKKVTKQQSPIHRFRYPDRKSSPKKVGYKW